MKDELKYSPRCGSTDMLSTLINSYCKFLNFSFNHKTNKFVNKRIERGTLTAVNKYGRKLIKLK